MTHQSPSEPPSVFPSSHVWNILHCNVGPSVDARAKGILKRQKKAGKALTGQAAKIKRRANLVSQGFLDEEILDELTASVGLAGQVFYVNGSNGKLPELPGNMRLKVRVGERDACAAARAYHAHTCLGSPGTEAGRDHGKAQGWAGPQQAFALAGKHPGSDEHICNMCITAEDQGEPVGILALSLDRSARGCAVQVIHVAKRVRGPMQLPAHLWAKALECVAETARGKGSRLVRFSLVMACCQSQQGAHFWMCRMGWGGTEHARQAAHEWGLGLKWKPGTYELWYELHVRTGGGVA